MDLGGVTALQARIVPDIGGGDAIASLRADAARLEVKPLFAGGRGVSARTRGGMFLLAPLRSHSEVAHYCTLRPMSGRLLIVSFWDGA